MQNPIIWYLRQVGELTEWQLCILHTSLYYVLAAALEKRGAAGSFVTVLNDHLENTLWWALRAQQRPCQTGPCPQGACALAFPVVQALKKTGKPLLDLTYFPGLKNVLWMTLSDREGRPKLKRTSWRRFPRNRSVSHTSSPRTPGNGMDRSR